MQNCNLQLPMMIDPINSALSSLSQRPARQKSLLRYLKKPQRICPICGKNQLDQVLYQYRNGGTSDCRDCNQNLATLCQILPPSPNPLERKVQANLIGGVYRFGMKHHFTPAAPILVTWELTTQCNMGGCWHCHVDAQLHRRSDSELATSEAKGVIDQLAEWGVCGIAFTGGESLLRKDFLKILGYATHCGLACYMATNGLLLTSDTIKALKEAGLSLVHISVDGSNKETHDYFRGYSGSFEQVIKAIKDCHSQGLQVALAATPTRLNASEMKTLLRLADNLGVDWFITYNYLPVGRGSMELDLDAQQKDQLWLDLLEGSGLCQKTRWLPFSPQMSVFGKITGRIDRISTTHYYEPLITSKIQTMIRASTACMAGRYYLAIKADGNVIPCIFLNISVGNVRNHSLADIWSYSRILTNLRDRHKIEGMCGRCVYSTSCGGCRARSYAYTGNYLASDPHCPVSARLTIGARSFLRNTHLHDYLLHRSL